MSNGYQNGTRTVYMGGYEYAGETHWHNKLYATESDAQDGICGILFRDRFPTQVKVVTKTIELYR